jgi:hypothetical protein
VGKESFATSPKQRTRGGRFSDRTNRFDPVRAVQTMRNLLVAMGALKGDWMGASSSFR